MQCILAIKYKERSENRMKTVVITRHAISNYGSLLQAIATQWIIEREGHECEILDYIRDDEHYSIADKAYLKNKPEWNNNFIKKMIYLSLRMPASIMAGRKFEEMRKKYLHSTKRYHNSLELKTDKPAADMYITGSDQVWGKIATGEYDGSYFLDFVDDDDKKVAMASSFGHFPQDEKEKAWMSELLKRYQKIAVREDSAVSFLKEFDICAEQVLDPTLIIEADKWRTLVRTKRTKKYVLVYQIHNDKRLGKYAKKMAKKMGLPLIRISSSLHQGIREGKFVFSPDICEFINYIDNAECLVTDSFHGTAFAINLNTNFVEILPNTNTGSRNQSILKLVGLTDRIVTDMDDFSFINKKIDFNKVNAIIEIEREKSLAVLADMLK